MLASMHSFSWWKGNMPITFLACNILYSFLPLLCRHT